MEKGYKVFNSDWTCRGFQYTVGETFEENVIPELCRRGFHYCPKLADCFSYYAFNLNNKVAEIEAIGGIDGGENENKHCTNKIKIVRELTWFEVLEMVNTGKGNTGYMNSGDSNSGNYNSGNYNSGNRNSGDSNSGNSNSGNGNSGNYNSGYYNSGNRNSGNRNSGNGNSGDSNSGDNNSGNYNSGNRNSGNSNSGNGNSGNYNSGYRNSGNYNRGNYNSGDYNLGSYHTGAFNTTDNPTILMFDKPTEWTSKDFKNSEAYDILSYCPFGVRWIRTSDMTEEEKENHPTYETTGGYIETHTKEDRQKWWDKLDKKDKYIVKSLPNFDEEKFIKCMDIDHI